MKTAILLLLMFFANSSLTEVRELYSNVTNSKEKQQQFIAYMQKGNSNSAVFQAYKGASLVMTSKTAQRNERKNLFVQGAEMIENAVAKEPENMEIRMIRLSIQENIPKAFNYNANIQEDVDFIKNKLKTTKDTELKTYVAHYVKQSKSFK